MNSPYYCGSTNENKNIPYFCCDNYVIVKVDSLNDITVLDRNHVYLLPNNTVWVWNYAGNGFVQLNIEGSGDITAVSNTDGYLTVDGSGTTNVVVNLNKNQIVQLIKDNTEIVTLSSAIDSDSEDTAATSLAVKTVNDKVVTIENSITSIESSLETLLSFDYICTGTADTTAIADIINDFFNNQTAMAGSLKIRSPEQMGVAFADGNNAMLINATNTRGAVFTLDFSDCDIPAITAETKDFLCVSSDTAKLNVTGLIATTTRYGINLLNSSNINFDNCAITGEYGVHIYNSSNNNFNNCVITGTEYGVLMNGSGNNNINNSTITGNRCVVVSDSNNNGISNCIITGSEWGIQFSGNSNNNNSVYSCIVTSSNYGIHFHSSFSGIAICTACKVVGSVYGVYAETSNTGAIVKLIGCAISGSGSDYDIYQASVASTMTWYITGNSFSYRYIYVNGFASYEGTGTANEYLHMLPYSNQFSRTIG